MVVSQQLLVRTIHVLAAAGLFGGSSALWAVFWAQHGATVRLLIRFEVAFWILLSGLVFTGLGNLGWFGVPHAETTAGTLLVAKFLIVLCLVFGSIVRSFCVVRLSRATVTETNASVLRWCYALTGITAGVLIVLAGVLVHG
ncbi:DUF2214 domain-containing protein [Natronolimnobius sp. AArcel1]|uniref:DUF2214 domain-containing protein n=1 Tax=Natronolimnobius sp. AArcel1 TaxID=1679093 RepID=UPI0013EA2027|nr:DUF2214 domain-containing protein [Natronolimnobius sp. AArcel1]NGM70680.1 DUF2214 domain-containing protein [Natronolimnobius sp. AArcel1]